MQKNLIWVVFLVLVIIAAAIFMARHFGVFGKTVKVPDFVMAVDTELIDRDTLALMTKTLGEWEKLGQKDGKYLNPETGTYSMEAPILCPSCGEKIPPAEIPAEYKGEWPKDIVERQRMAYEVLKIQMAYKCPRCGKPAFTGL